MSIEAKIEELTAALKDNTLALREVLAASASTAAPAEPKPAKKKAKAKKSEPEPEPEPAKDEPEATEPPAKDEPEAEPAPDAPTLVAKITEAVKNAITAPDADPDAVKKAWRAVCAEFGVERISELTDTDKLTEALAKAEAL